MRSASAASLPPVPPSCLVGRARTSLSDSVVGGSLKIGSAVPCPQCRGNPPPKPQLGTPRLAALVGLFPPRVQLVVGHFPPDSDPSPRPKSVQSTPGQLHPPCSRASSPRRPSGRHVDRAPSGGERAMSTTPQRWRWRRRACGRRQAAAGPFSLGGQAHCVGCARVVCRAAVIIGQGCRPTGVNFQERSSPCLRPTAPCGANMGMGGGGDPLCP